MGDIAQIGFAADTSGLDETADSLNKLVPAANAADKALGNVSDALDDVGSSADDVNQSATKVTTSQTAVSKTVIAATGAIVGQTAANKAAKGANDNATDSVNKLAKGHEGLGRSGMAAEHSIKGLIEGIATGQAPSEILLGQFNHLVTAASGSGGLSGAFGKLGAELSAMITVTSVAVVGIAALAIGLGVAVVSVLKAELALQDLSNQTNLTIADVHGLQQAMSFKGISVDDSTKAMQQFATNVNDAQHNMGSLNGLMLANNMQAKTFNQYLGNVAELVSQTSDGVQKQNIALAAGLPPTQDMIRFLNQGRAGIIAATAATVQFNTAAEQNLIDKAREFDEKWNVASTNFKSNFQSAIIGVLSLMDGLESKILTLMIIAGAAIAIAFAPISLIVTALAATIAAAAAAAKLVGLGQTSTNPDGSPAPKRVVMDMSKPTAAATGAQPQTNAQMQKANSDQMAQISLLGDLATVQQQVTAKKLALNNAYLQGNGISATAQAQVLLGVQAAAEQNRVNQQATIGVFNLNDATKAASDTLQHWIDQKLLDPTNTQQMAAAQAVLARNIQATSDAAKVAAAPFQQLKQLELDGSNMAKQLDTAATGALNNMVQPIQDMMNGVTGLSAGFSNLGVVVLNAIQQMIIKMLILTPIARALQGVMSSMGIGLSGVSNATDGVGGFGPTAPLALAASAKGNIFANDNMQKFGSGGAFTNAIVSQPTLFKYANGAALGMMGEAGPEAIMPLKRGPSGSLGVQMYGAQSGGNDNSQQVTYAPQYTLGGNVTQDDLNNVKKAQQQDREQFTSRVAQAIPALRKRNVRV